MESMQWMALHRSVELAARIGKVKMVPVTQLTRTYSLLSVDPFDACGVVDPSSSCLCRGPVESAISNENRPVEDSMNCFGALGLDCLIAFAMDPMKPRLLSN